MSATGEEEQQSERVLHTELSDSPGFGCLLGSWWKLPFHAFLQCNSSSANVEYRRSQSGQRITKGFRFRPRQIMALQAGWRPASPRSRAPAVSSATLDDCNIDFILVETCDGSPQAFPDGGVPSLCSRCTCIPTLIGIPHRTRSNGIRLGGPSHREPRC